MQLSPLHKDLQYNLDFVNARVKDRIEFKNVDIYKKDKFFDQYFENVDWVFHLAGMADIVPSIEKPEAYFKANVEGTLNVLQAAKSASVKSFVYSASSSCYGLPDLSPTPEGSEIKPMYPYALTKYLGEQLFEEKK